MTHQEQLASTRLSWLGPKTTGKVRDIYDLGDRLAIVTTDRLSAFDRILGQIPHKGQVLNELSAFWFAQTQHIVVNHFVEMPDPNVTIARKCQPLPVEVVVRGYITGVTSTALWYRYNQGERTIYGIDFPDGLKKNAPLPEPIITPTTKAQAGGHDERITSAEVVSSGLVEAEQWQEVCAVATALFRFGQELAKQNGLILVDTKYEFGVDPKGNLCLIDEAHTPDSSRFWLAASYAARLAQGAEPENYDKEFIRLYYANELGYRGEGEPPALPDELAMQASQRYREVFQRVTGRTMAVDSTPILDRIEANMRQWIAHIGR